jgi:cellulose synthase/poly-beta-1,6-N-acetylglucosamine synthase-like glycosyltransferase
MIEQYFHDAYWLLSQQTMLGIILLFWYTSIFDIPRYTTSFLTAGLAGLKSQSDVSRNLARTSQDLSVTVVVPGHNEEDALERCVRSLHEQTLKGFEIVIASDGSTDRTAEIASRMVRLGLADRYFYTDLRCGKSSAMNLAERFASGDIVIVVDCDCSYDRYALANIVQPFLDDENVGAVSGDIEVRNGDATVVTGLQSIEYLMTISVSKRVEDLFGMVVCASGAFSAFRKSALESVGGVDVGGGEDFDLTVKLRRRGWRVRYASDAICYTDAPTAVWTLIRQRLRWERDSIRIRYRKQVACMNPLSPSFNPVETIHQLDFLFFHVVASVILPFYLIWLFTTLGAKAIVILAAIQVGLLLVELLSFVMAIGVTGRMHMLRFAPLIAINGVFVGYLMRFVRLWAYFEEWFFDTSREDNYVPHRVRHARLW